MPEQKLLLLSCVVAGAGLATLASASPPASAASMVVKPRLGERVAELEAENAKLRARLDALEAVVKIDGEDVTIKAAKTLRLRGAKVKARGDNLVDLSSEKKVKVAAEQRLDLSSDKALQVSAGVELTLDSDMVATLEGKVSTDVQSDGPVQVDGSAVLLNLDGGAGTGKPIRLGTGASDESFSPSVLAEAHE